jgi:class 3 adenylate cyclase
LLFAPETHADDVDEASYIASLMPSAEVRTLPGELISSEAIAASLEEMRRFIGVEPPTPELDTVLATILFTDIVRSTETQSALGDRAWKDLIQRHHAIVRKGARALARHRSGHCGRRVLCHVRWTGPGDPVRARYFSTRPGTRDRGPRRYPHR